MIEEVIYNEKKKDVYPQIYSKILILYFIGFLNGISLFSFIYYILNKDLLWIISLIIFLGTLPPTKKGMNNKTKERFI